MTTVKYIIKNVVVTMRKSPMIFALFILCTFVSVLVVIFSHGVYQNYKSLLTFEDVNWSFIENSPNITFGDVTNTYVDEDAGLTNYIGEDSSTLSEFRQVLDLLDDKTKSSFTGFTIYYDSFSDTYSFHNQEKYGFNCGSVLYSRLEYDTEAHDYGLYSTYIDNAVNPRVGRYITQDEELKGKQVIYLPYDCYEDLVGEKITFLDKEYEVVGIQGEDEIYNYIVPFKTLPDDLEFDSVALLTDKIITTDTYRKIKEAFTSVYGDNVNFPDFKTADPTEHTFYVSIMLISVALTVLSAINLAILFRYIMHARRKRLAVFRLSGCTRLKSRIMYLFEVGGIAVIIFAICSVIFNYLIMPRLMFAFPKIEDVYSVKTYLFLFGIFIFILLAAINIIFSFSVEKQPVDMFKKAGDK